MFEENAGSFFILFGVRRTISGFGENRYYGATSIALDAMPRLSRQLIILFTHNSRDKIILINSLNCRGHLQLRTHYTM